MLHSEGTLPLYCCTTILFHYTYALINYMYYSKFIKILHIQKIPSSPFYLLKQFLIVPKHRSIDSPSIFFILLCLFHLIFLRLHESTMSLPRFIH